MLCTFLLFPLFMLASLSSQNIGISLGIDRTVIKVNLTLNDCERIRATTSLCLAHRTSMSCMAIM